VNKIGLLSLFSSPGARPLFTIALDAARATATRADQEAGGVKLRRRFASARALLTERGSAVR